jgi:hypothetical protein
MKKISLLFFTLLSFLSIAQKENNNESKFRIGIYIQPNIDYRRLFGTGENEITTLIIDSRNDYEISKIGYNIGLNTEFTITEKISIESGVSYSNKGYKSKKIDAIFPQGPEPSGLVAVQISYLFNYIEIPLQLNYKVGNNKLRFISSFGASINIMLSAQEKTKIFYGDGSSQTNKLKVDNSYTYAYNKLNIFPTISLGAEYLLNNNLTLRVQPTFNYGVLKIIDSPIRANLWSFGLKVGGYISL